MRRGSTNVPRRPPKPLQHDCSAPKISTVPFHTVRVDIKAKAARALAAQTNRRAARRADKEKEVKKWARSAEMSLKEGQWKASSPVDSSTFARNYKLSMAKKVRLGKNRPVLLRIRSGDTARSGFDQRQRKSPHEIGKSFACLVRHARRPGLSSRTVDSGIHSAGSLAACGNSLSGSL